MSNEQPARQTTQVNFNPIEKDGLCLLSLDGGGVRGLSTLHILKRIMDEINRLRADKNQRPCLPCQVFDIIGGTSTGGLIAIMLGRLGMSVDECIKAYEELMESIFGAKSHWMPISMSANINAKYDSQKIKQEIEGVLRQRDIAPESLFNDGNKRNCRVFVCAVSKDTGDAVRIRSYDQVGRGNIPATICEAALATSAATSFFDPVSIGASQYVDGALRHNNPISEVEAEAQDLWCPDDGTSNVEDLKSLVKCFISIGTGAPPKTEIPNNVIKLMSKLRSLATDTEAANKSFQDRWRRALIDKRFFRFDVAQGLQDVGLAAHEKQGTIKEATSGYLDEREQQNKLHDCTENLVKKDLDGTPLDFHKKISSYKIRNLLQGGYDIEDIINCRSVLYVTDVDKDRSNLKSDKGIRVPGTFEWITGDNKYRDWLTSGSETLQITAGPGRGKTMLSLFMLENIENYLTHSARTSGFNDSTDRMKGADLYFFFCSGGDGNRRDSVKVLRSLIHQIITKHESLVQHVLDFLQPMAPGSHQYHETNRPTNVDKQMVDECEKQSGKETTGRNQRSRSTDNQDLAPHRLPLKSSLVQRIFSSSSAPEGEADEGMNARKDAKKESKEGFGSKPNFFQNMLGQSRKDSSKTESEKQAESQPEDPPVEPKSAPEKESPKIRQLELLGASELSFILGKLIQELDVDAAYFLLDGVDECGKEEQEALTDKLLDLCNIKPGKFRLLVVSRPISGMGKIPTIKLEQITSDIEKFVSHSVEQLSNVDGFSEQIRGEVERTLLTGAEGTFLWVSLVMSELKKKGTCTEILDTLKTVPRGLNAKYSHMLRQIDKYHQQNVFQMLRWVTAAFRPMNLQELSVVIVKPPDSMITPEQAVRDAVIGSAGLLEVRGNQVTFVHTSAKDFLLSDDSENDEALKKFLVGLEQLHYEAAQFCYDCIRRSDLRRSEIKISELPDDEEPKLLKYAIKHWIEHVKASGWAEKNFDYNAEFFKRDSKLRKNWWTAYLEDTQNDEPKNFNVASLVHMSAYFGILPWIKPAFEGKSWVVNQGSILMERDHYNRTPLHIAVEQGHGRIVQLLIEQGTDVTAKEASQFATPLHLAARNGHKNICEILLDHKARINARNMFKQTPLTEAARGGHIEVVKLLVNRGADVNGSIDKQSRSIYRHIESVPFYVKRRLRNIAGASYEQRSTPVIEAARRSHTEIIRYLIERKKADIEAKTLAGQNALHIAACHDQTKSMEVLVELGASIEKKDDTSHTPLFLASWKNNPEAVRWLVERKANIDTATHWGFTPLHVAARNGYEEPMNILLEAQAKLEYQDEEGHTPLTVAALWGKVEAVKILIIHGANIEAQDLSGNTALMQAIQDNLTDKHMEIVKVLLEHGVNVQHRNRKGLTPLMKAAQVSKDHASDIVHQLLDMGAAIDAQDTEGRTVLMYALVNGVEKTRELLLDHGAALEIQDDLGDTALIVAAGHSSTNAVRWLLDHGANSDIRDNLGYTPLIKAAKCGYEDTLKLLLDRGANIDAVDNENKSAIDHAAIRERGEIIKLLMARGANRRKLTAINHAAAALSDIMYLNEEACREWERDWETEQLKKIDRESRERQDSDLSKTDEEAPVQVDAIARSFDSNMQREGEERNGANTQEKEEALIKESVPKDVDLEKTKASHSEEDTGHSQPDNPATEHEYKGINVE